MLADLVRTLSNPAARPLLEVALKRVFGVEDDYTRLHWGAEDCTTCVSLTPPASPDKLVSLGLAVGFYEARRTQELFIARGRSPYRVTTHGIEG